MMKMSLWCYLGTLTVVPVKITAQISMSFMYMRVLNFLETNFHKNILILEIPIKLDLLQDLPSLVDWPDPPFHEPHQPTTSIIGTTYSVPD